MASIYRHKINSLELNMLNSLVVGVVITSLNVKTFQTNSKNRPGTRAVWTFTIRDAHSDTINVTVWGDEGFVNNAYDKFRIGTVVEVINAKVQARQLEGQNEKFSPSTSSPFNLVVNEGMALIQLHDEPDKDSYVALLHVPMGSGEEIKCLREIMNNLEHLKDQYVNILAAVTFVSEPRNIVTKEGRALMCCDFEVSDGTTEDRAGFKIWEYEWIRRCANWEPKKTVLYLSHVLVTFDKYKNKMTLMIVRKTIITEDPNIPEAEEIRLAVSTTDLDAMPKDPYILPKPEAIKSIMTIKQITDKLNKSPPGKDRTDRVQFLVRLFATVTEVSMGSGQSDVLIARCAICKRTVATGQECCMNLDCPSGNGKLRPMNVYSFYFKLNLKDETGYLIGCRLTGSAAEKAFGCTVEEFKDMTQTQREELKWTLTLEQCDVRLQVLGPTLTSPRAIYNILLLQKVHENEDIDNFSATTSSESSSH